MSLPSPHNISFKNYTGEEKEGEYQLLQLSWKKENVLSLLPSQKRLLQTQQGELYQAEVSRIQRRMENFLQRKIPEGNVFAAIGAQPFTHINRIRCAAIRTKTVKESDRIAGPNTGYFLLRKSD